jgi:hypothetical protein
MIKLYIGANNSTKRLERGKIYRIISRYVDGYTCYEATGCWKNGQEKTLVAEIEGVGKRKGYKMSRELLKELKQEAIGFKGDKGGIKFIK